MTSMLGIYVALAVAAFAAGLSKGGLGGSLAAMVTPLLVLVMPAPIAVGLSLPLLMSGDLFAVIAHWRKWDWKIIVKMLPGTVVGVMLGTLAIKSITPLLLQRFLGVIAILYTAYKFWERRSGRMTTIGHGWLGGTIFGFLTGFTSTLLNAGGPVIAMYLLMLNVTPAIFISTTAAYFFLLNAMKIPSFVSAGILQVESLVVVGAFMPIVPFAVWSGVIIAKKINRQTFETLILLLLVATGVLLLVK